MIIKLLPRRKGNSCRTIIRKLWIAEVKKKVNCNVQEGIQRVHARRILGFYVPPVDNNFTRLCSSTHSRLTAPWATSGEIWLISTFPLRSCSSSRPSSTQLHASSWFISNESKSPFRSRYFHALTFHHSFFFFLFQEKIHFFYSSVQVGAGPIIEYTSGFVYIYIYFTR